MDSNVQEIRVDRELEQEIPHLRRAARFLHHRQEAADELVAECLTSASKNLRDAGAQISVRLWLLKTLWRVHLGRTPIGELGDSPPPPPPATGRNEAHTAGRTTVADGIFWLDDPHRFVLLLVPVSGLSYSEAAFVLDIPEDAVNRMLARARGRLRDVMEAQLSDPVARSSC